MDKLVFVLIGNKSSREIIYRATYTFPRGRDMNKKTIVIGVVALLVIAGVGIYALSNSNDDNTGSSYTLLSRVNTDGSGIYIKASVLEARELEGLEFYTDNGDGTYSITTDNASAWGGLVFGTPGTTSIQHIQLQTIVEEMLGLTFTLYQNGMTIESDHVYYVSTITNATAALSSSTESIIDGGILWQPQYQAIIDDESGTYAGLALSNNLFPGHTCCVLAGSTSYITSNSDVTVSFLAAYVEGVKWVQSALKDTSSEDYQELVDLCSSKVSGLSQEEIEESLSTIVYTYGDSDVDDPLASLTVDVANLTDSLESLGSLKHTMADLGFDNSTDFAETFVDGSYLSKVLNGEASVQSSTVTVKVAVITGDLHQIALHAAIENGFFEEYGINVELSGATNGAGVAVALQNGTVQFGLMGAPPATITTINSELIKA